MNHPIPFFTTFLMIIPLVLSSQIPIPEEFLVTPAFQVDLRAPTEDKPQSKSWNTGQDNWIVVPNENGPELWHGNRDQWTSVHPVNKGWEGLPGKADVCTSDRKAMVLFVGNCELHVSQLSYSGSNNQYREKFRASLPVPDDCHEIETGTITLDSRGQWWVCTDLDEKIMIWHSPDGMHWSGPTELAAGINDDDISVITGVPGHGYVSVIWSDQNHESVSERIHSDDDRPGIWSPATVVQMGNKNADDHLNTTVLPDNTLMVMSKNSVDKVHHPQFVLRVKTPEGNWSNTGCINLTQEYSITRPIITHTNSGKIFELHSVHPRNTNVSYISVNEVIRKDGQWNLVEKCRIHSKSPARLNNVTASKGPFLENSPWNIYCSDNNGNVYAFDLSRIQE